MKTLLILPILGILFIALTPSETLYAQVKLKQFALFTTLVTLSYSIYLWVSLDWGIAEMQQVLEIRWYHENVITLGLDGISIIYILLTTLIFPICILASWNNVKFLQKQYWISLLAIEFLLICVFSVFDLLAFYICFEAVLIPMYLLIGVWGAREEKITASYYFFFYTLIGSVFFLISIIYIYKITGSTDYWSILHFQISNDIQIFLFLAFFASLAVKIPVFPFHIWLPLAHVEAPLAGSILLAGVLIKLGSYGFLRFALPILPYGCSYFSPMIFTLSILGIIYAGLTTIRQTDLKRIIAYSSVGHMAVIMLGLFSLNIVGIEGSLFLQIGHGIVSSALFIIVTILYDRHHTRIVKYYRGVTTTMPLYSSIFLFFTLANIAVPLSCNFIGEILCIIGTFEINRFIAILASTGMIISASYALFLYNRVAFGSMSIYLSGSPENRDIDRREFYILLPLILLTLILGILPNLLLESIHAGVLLILSYM